MADLNKVFLMGRLTFDPELRQTPSGTAVTDLRLATNRSWTGQDGERKEETLFIDVTVWDRQAETCCQYLKKGSGVHVEGSSRWTPGTTRRPARSGRRSRSRPTASSSSTAARTPAAGAGGDVRRRPRGRDDEPPRRPAGPRRGNGAGRPGGDRAGPGPAPRRPAPPPTSDPDGEDEDIPF